MSKFVYPHAFNEVDHHGLTLRDWFAGMALTGLTSSGKDFYEQAVKAYLYADAMMDRRKKEDAS